MDSRSAYLKRPPVLATVVLVAVFSAQVQYAPLQAGQPILFSSPRNNAISSNVPALASKPLESLDLGNGSQVPLPFDFNAPLIAAPPLPGAPVISPAEQAQLQDALDRRKNWVFLTPAEILGVTTPEKILGIRERDASGQPKNSTALERYTERQNQLLSAKPNAFQNGSLSPAENLSQNRLDQSDAFNSSVGGLEKPVSTMKPQFPYGPDHRASAGQSQNDGQSESFGSTTPSSAPNAAQQMNPDWLRQLLGSSPLPVPAATPSSNDKKFSLPGMSLDIKLGQPSFNPLNGGDGNPATLPALPNALAPSYTSPQPAATWAPPQPPWLSADPQLFAAPQRKF